jgi:hypothetical protein
MKKLLLLTLFVAGIFCSSALAQVDPSTPPPKPRHHAVQPKQHKPVKHVKKAAKHKKVAPHEDAAREGR